MVPSREYGRRCGEDQGGGAGWLFEDLEEDVGDIVPAHGFGAVEDKNAAAAHGLEIRGALNGANLADAQHGARDGSFAGARDRERAPRRRDAIAGSVDALDGGGVGAFAALGDALLDELLRIGEERDALAGVRTRRRNRR